MKLAVLADVHGNLPALQAVLEDLCSSAPDKILVAGDLIAGPFSDEVIKRLGELDAWMILGNSDRLLVRFLDGETSEPYKTSRQFGLLRWNARHISNISLQLLKILPEQNVFQLHGTDAIRMVHGSPQGISESIFPEQDISILDHALGMIPEKVLVCGHTHRPWKRRRNGKLALNPGSVAGPLNGDIGAQYARLTWLDGRWQAELRTISYDPAPLICAFKERGLLEEGGPIARAFLESILSGCDVARAFFKHAHELAAQANYREKEFIPDEILELADRTFVWQTWKRS